MHKRYLFVCVLSEKNSLLASLVSPFKHRNLENALELASHFYRSCIDLWSSVVHLEEQTR